MTEETNKQGHCPLKVLSSGNQVGPCTGGVGAIHHAADTLRWQCREVDGGVAEDQKGNKTTFGKVHSHSRELGMPRPAIMARLRKTKQVRACTHMQLWLAGRANGWKHGWRGG